MQQKAKKEDGSMTMKLAVRREKGKIWSHIRQKWLNETPEESVRQEFLCVLVAEYGLLLTRWTKKLK